MTDFSRALPAKNHKLSVETAANNIISYVNELLSKYNIKWEELEKNRKEMASLIEEIIQILKANSIKTNIPLGKCNNSELNTEVNAVIDMLDLAQKEEIQCNLVKINNRFSEIVRIGKALNEIVLELSRMRLPEKDYKEETVLDLTKKVKEKVQESEKIEMVVNEEKPKEEVIAISSPSKALLSDLNDKLSLTYESPFEVPELHLDENPEEVEELPEESLEDLFNQYVNQEYSSLENDEDEYVIYEIRDGESFVDINDKVFEGQVPWEELYNYDDNKTAIITMANQLNKSIEAIVNDKHYLTGINIKIPFEITYEQQEETLSKIIPFEKNYKQPEETMKKAA